MAASGTLPPPAALQHCGSFLGCSGRTGDAVGESLDDPIRTFEASLFDHLIGALLKMQRHIEAERLGGLEVDHQLELDWGLDGKLAWFRALEDAIDIGRRKPKLIALLTSVG